MGARLHFAPLVAGLFTTLALSACLTPDQPIPPPLTSGTSTAMPIFVDTIVSETAGGQVHDCLPPPGACGTMGPCDPHPARGTNDNNFYNLNALDILEVAFLCDVIKQHGDGALNSLGTNTDFKIWSSVPQGAQANVEISYDGVKWSNLTLLTQSNQEFSLGFSQPLLEMARYIRITNIGSAAIGIDAIEGL